MTDEPRTVREAGYTGLTTLKGLVAFDDRNPILDALIGAQGRVVYTAEDVERCTTAVGVELIKVASQVGETMTFDVTNESLEQKCSRIACAAITAAGGVVTDEVVEVACPSMSDALWVTDTRMLNDGDKLYIVRAVTASRSEEE